MKERLKKEEIDVKRGRRGLSAGRGMKRAEGNRSRGHLGETQAVKWENCSYLCILFRPQIMCQY